MTETPSEYVTDPKRPCCIVVTLTFEKGTDPEDVKELMATIKRHAGRVYSLCPDIKIDTKAGVK